MTGTRITPDQLLPDVGGLYRHRETGQLASLYSVSQMIVHVDRPDGSACWMHLAEFWRTYIHSEART